MNLPGPLSGSLRLIIGDHTPVASASDSIPFLAVPHARVRIKASFGGSPSGHRLHCSL